MNHRLASRGMLSGREAWKMSITAELNCLCFPRQHVRDGTLMPGGGEELQSGGELDLES